MLHNCDNLIQDILVDSELAKTLVPNKFKHTSKQGRVRRQQLLLCAKKLVESVKITDISLADICKEAGIPRASAYHFFPNVESIFLALRFLNYIETINTISKVQVTKFELWQDYIRELILQCVDMFNNDITKIKLMYDSNAPDFEGSNFEDRVDSNMAGMIVRNISENYDVSNHENLHNLFLIAYNIANSIFSLSFRKFNMITDEMADEALKAAVAYLSCYLPERLQAL